MIENTRQDWKIGQIVKVGFLNLVVKSDPIAAGDGPDQYLLSNIFGDQAYAFQPHRGVRRISAADAADLLCTAAQAAAAKRLAETAREQEKAKLDRVLAP